MFRFLPYICLRCVLGPTCPYEWSYNLYTKNNANVDTVRSTGMLGHTLRARAVLRRGYHNRLQGQGTNFLPFICDDTGLRLSRGKEHFGNTAHKKKERVDSVAQSQLTVAG